MIKKNNFVETNSIFKRKKKKKCRKNDKKKNCDKPIFLRQKNCDKKSRIRGTPNLLTNADRKTNTERNFFLGGDVRIIVWTYGGGRGRWGSHVMLER